MNQHGYDLAIYGAQLFERSGPKYEEVRDGLNGMLGGVAVETALDRARDAEDNMQLLGKVLEDLPFSHREATKEGMETDDLADLAWLKYGLVWWKGRELNNEGPYYVIGEKNQGGQQELLLHRAAIALPPHRPDLFVVRVPAKPFTAVRDQRFNDAAQQKPLTPAETNRLYIPEISKLRLTADAEGVVQIHEGRQVVPNALRRGKAAVASTLPGAMERDLSKGIDDQDLSHYDVWAHLWQLSQAFGKLPDTVRTLKRQQMIKAGEELEWPPKRAVLPSNLDNQIPPPKFIQQ